MHALSSDPLLSYIRSVADINSRASRASAASHASAASGSTNHPRSSGIVGTAAWELRFSELTFLRPVGEGSLAKVYLALWHETEVACKVLLAGGSAGITSSGDAARALALSSPIMHQLEEEAGLLAALRHPNVIQFFGICHQPPCFITEYCARGSLYEVLSHARQDEEAAAQMTWPRRLSLALGAAKGMLFLHARPTAVLHRDLKSPNLLVTDEWVVKVTDFNLSKAIEEAAPTNSSSIAATNPRWLAPEVLHGGRATRAADVYAFGIVLWEILTWKLPFPGVNPWALAGYIMRGGRPEVPPLEELPGPGAAAFSGLDAYIRLMEDCWAQEPQDRPSFEDVVPRLRVLRDDAEGGVV